MPRHRNQLEKRQQQISVREEQRLRIGPIPSPEQLAAFDRILPGLADRITRMAEGHARNRWSNDRAARIVSITSPVFAFIVAMTIICGGLWLVSIGLSLEGLAAVFLTISGIIYALYKMPPKRD